MADKVDEVAVKELLPFLASDARADVKSLALSYILGLSGSDRGKNFLKDNEEYLKGLLDLTMDSNSSISNDAFSVLVNLSAESVITEKLLQFTFLRSFLTYILNPSSDHAEKATMILSNVARSEMGCREVLKVTSSTEDCSLHKIVEVLCLEKYNPKAKLTYLSPFLSNLTQLKESRDFILDRNRCVIQRLLPFTVYKQSVVKRGGIVGALRNCCFETGAHEWLLSDSVDILPHLLLPLAGPEEFPEDDMEKLPPDVQYLEEDKERETDPDIRRMLLEALLLLCTTKHGRDTMREKNVYVILRELHKWETDEEAKKACANLIQVLISDEPEAGMENLREVEIPDHVKFDET